jgi:hypothetical protein
MPMWLICLHFLSPDLINLGKACVVAVQSYDNALGTMENMKAAEAKFNDIISSPIRDIPSKKIDNLAKKNQLGLDPSLLTVPTKAWSEAKETTLVKDEVRLELALYYTSISSAYFLLVLDTTPDWYANGWIRSKMFAVFSCQIPGILYSICFVQMFILLIWVISS